MSADSLDVPATIARQSVATAILGPYMAGLAVQLVLDGAYIALFINDKAELDKHGKRGRWASWAVFASIIACMGMAIEEVFDTGGEPTSMSAQTESEC